MKIIYARKEEVEFGVFAVVAALGNGRVAYHEGPKNVAYFTETQADDLVCKIQSAKEINPAHWVFDNSDPFSDLRNMEDEYYARMTGE